MDRGLLVTDPRWQAVRGWMSQFYDSGPRRDALAALNSLEAEWDKAVATEERDKWWEQDSAWKARAERAEAERDAAHVLRDATVRKYLEQRLAAEAEVERLQNRLRDAPLGGDGSHWEGCWRYHIDCARARAERFAAERADLEQRMDDEIVAHGKTEAEVERLRSLLTDCADDLEKVIADERAQGEEVERLRAFDEATATAEILHLQAENERLREALTRIEGEAAASWIADIARAALEGEENE